MLLGWVLFVMCLAGTLSVFKPEIGRWMRPEATAHAGQAQALTAAVRWLDAHAAKSSGWYLTLPDARMNTLEATYDPITKKLTYILAWRDLTGPATAAHFHGPADATANAGVAVPINVTIGNPVNGGADLNDGQAADLAAGKWYVNVHTEAHKGGEIRGQMMKVN